MRLDKQSQAFSSRYKQSDIFQQAPYRIYKWYILIAFSWFSLSQINLPIQLYWLVICRFLMCTQRKVSQAREDVYNSRIYRIPCPIIWKTAQETRSVCWYISNCKRPLRNASQCNQGHYFKKQRGKSVNVKEQGREAPLLVTPVFPIQASLITKVTDTHSLQPCQY